MKACSHSDEINDPLVQSVEYSRAVRTVRIPPCGPDGTSIARASNVPGIEDTDDMDDIGDPDMVARSESTTPPCLIRVPVSVLRPIESPPLCGDR